jgi:hypothetical protein
VTLHTTVGPIVIHVPPRTSMSSPRVLVYGSDVSTWVPWPGLTPARFLRRCTNRKRAKIQASRAARKKRREVQALLRDASALGSSYLFSAGFPWS